MISCNYYSCSRSAAREMQEVWGPLGCLGLLLFITAMNKRIMISEILPSSSGCKFNSFKNRGNLFALMRASLIRFFWFLTLLEGLESQKKNGRNYFFRPYQNGLCLMFDFGHSPTILLTSAGPLLKFQLMNRD